MLDLALFRNPRFSSVERRDLAGLLRPVRDDLLADPAHAVVRGYGALGAGIAITAPSASCSPGPSSTRLAEQLRRRGSWSGSGWCSSPAAMYLISLAGRRRLRADRRRDPPDGLRHRPPRWPGHRRDHGRAARGQAERRLGDQRHHAVAGGALGVAVLGSLLASSYRGDMDSIAGAPELARDSLAGALAHGQPAADRRRRGIRGARDTDRDARRRSAVAALVGWLLVSRLMSLPGEERASDTERGLAEPP